MLNSKQFSLSTNQPTRSCLSLKPYLELVDNMIASPRQPYVHIARLKKYSATSIFDINKMISLLRFHVIIHTIHHSYTMQEPHIFPTLCTTDKDIFLF